MMGRTIFGYLGVGVGPSRLFALTYALLVFQVACRIPFASAFDPKITDQWKCEPVTLDVCSDVEYNETIVMGLNFPNPITKKTSQLDSKSDLDLFKPLLQASPVCSPKLRLFLCSIYAPFCSQKAKTPIIACQPLCNTVKRQCSAAMEAQGLPWPAALDCDQLPARNDARRMCIGGDVTGGGSRNQYKPPSKRTKKPKRRRKTRPKDPKKVISKRTYCRMLYLHNNANYFYIDKLQACALQCSKDGLYTLEEKQTMEKCLSVLSCVCGLLCVLALAVTVFQYQHTCYPERSIIFITLCYLFYSLAYIIRIIYTRESVTCRQTDQGLSYLLVDGSGNLSCASTFLLTYCFCIAQNIWWVMLCFSWFIRAGLKWRPDLIRSLSMYFHIFSWSVPCAMTVIVLVVRKIDVNELTGVCFIGNRYENLAALRAFVLGPLFTFLTMGIVFLLFGFIALFRISSDGYNHDEPTLPNKLEPPLLPVGVYAALHAFFSSYIFASYYYEYHNKTSWYREPTSDGPNFQVFLIRVVMDFSIGISAALWLLLVHFPRCLRRKFYHHSPVSGIGDITTEHTGLTAIKATRMNDSRDFSNVANTTTENTTLTSVKSRVDTSELSI